VAAKSVGTFFLADILLLDRIIHELKGSGREDLTFVNHRCETELRNRCKLQYQSFNAHIIKVMFFNSLVEFVNIICHSNNQVFRHFFIYFFYSNGEAQMAPKLLTFENDIFCVWHVLGGRAEAPKTKCLKIINISK